MAIEENKECAVQVGNVTEVSSKAEADSKRTQLTGEQKEALKENIEFIT